MDASARRQVTETVALPLEWQITSLKDLQAFITSGSRGWAQYYRDSGTPFIRITNMIRGSIRIDHSELKFVTPPPDDPEATRTLLNSDDILMSITADIGLISFVSKDDCPSFINQHIALIRIPPDVASAKFIAYQLASPESQKAIRSTVDQGAKAGMNLAQVARAITALPPLHEQRAIATALTDVDDLLTSLDRLIAKKRAIKQGVMHDLLTGRKRLPGFSGEWEVRRLGDLARMASGGTPPSSVTTYYGGTIPWVSIADMTKAGKRLTTTIKTLSQSGLDNSAAQVFPANIVLYAMYASLGECSIAQIPVATSQAILGIEPGPALDYVFLYYHLLLSKDSVRSMGQHGTQANLNKGMVQDFQLNLPSLHEQRAIATVLTDMDDEIDALQSRRDKTHAIKQAMMHELLTGRTRLV